MIKFLARIAIAALVAMMPIMAAPVAIAKPNEPVQCVPEGVEKKPDGSVWAVERCDGQKILTRMSGR